MKYKILLCLSLILLYPLKSIAQQEFEVNINLKGIKSVSADPVVFGLKEAVTHEPFEIKDGKFTFKGKATEAVVVRLWLNNDKQLSKLSADGGGSFPVKSEQIWFIVYPGAKVLLEGDINGKDFMDAYPKDGSENDYFAVLNREMMPLISEIGNLMAESTKADKTVEERAEIKTRSDELNRKLTCVNRRFIEKYPNSIAALWLMDDMLSRSQIEVKELFPIFGKIDKNKYGENSIYHSVYNRMNGEDASREGQMCPNFSSDATFDGKTISFSDFKGKYLLIDFWGTWCMPCMKGMSHIKAFMEEYKDKLQVLGIAQEKNAETWKKVIESKGLNWSHIMNGSREQNFVEKFNVKGFPTKLLINPQGKIVLRSQGESEDFYEKAKNIINSKK